MIYQSCWEGAESVFWENTEEISWNNQTIQILTPDLQLLHTIAHGLRWNEMSSIRWIQDSMIILQKRSDDLNWSNLVTVAERLRLTYVLKTGIKILQTDFRYDFPENFLNQLSAVKEHPLEQKLYHSVNAPDKTSYFRSKWYIYSIGSGQRSIIKRLIGFPGYLKRKWNLRSFWSVFNFFF